tara:strand:- start:8 stop:292 length:285 start_codon:yes stop_codon:yes gene_type:complete
MRFNPVNRHVWVEVLREAQVEETSDILLPEEYTQKKLPHATCKVLKSARDCNLMLIEGDLIIVDTNMIQELKSNSNAFSVVLENYIYGVLEAAP